MRKNDLIKKLALIPKNPHIVVADTIRNGRDIDGQATPEGSAEGIYRDFDVRRLAGDDLAEGCLPVIAIVITPDPEPILVKLIRRLNNLGDLDPFWNHTEFQSLLNDFLKLIPKAD